MVLKKYLQNVIWQPILIPAVVAALLCSFLLPGKASVWAVALIILICAGYFLLNRICQNLIKKTAPTSYFQDLRWRNTNAIAVGSTYAWKYARFNPQQCYDATGFRRSNLMCYHMLRTYHSHVKPGGTVFYVVDPAESKKIGVVISPGDFAHIHPHVFLKLGVTHSHKQQVNPLIYAGPYSIGLLLQYVLKCFAAPTKKPWRKANTILSECDCSTLSAQLQDVAKFCSERDLCCKIIYIHRKSEDPTNASQIMAAARGLAECIVVSSPAELNAVLCSNETV